MKKAIKKAIKKVIILSFAFLIIAMCGILFLSIKYGPDFNVYLFPPTTQKYVEIALNKMDNGLYASGAVWEEKKASVLEQCPNLSDYASTHDLLNEALFVAGGKHSGLFSAGEQKVEATEQEMPTVSMDEQGILYVKLPGFVGVEGAQQYADTVVTYVKKNQDRIKGVIVDLQGNTGGNLGPMLAALSPFLPDGQLLAFRIKDKDMPVTLLEGTVTGGGSNVTVDSVKIANVPVAILQNEQTASSGEAVILAFRGLDYTQTFGEASAGYCSCNTVFYLYDGAMMQLTIGSDVARTGEEFCEEPIAPDVETANSLEVARKWILERVPIGRRLLHEQ